MCYNTSYRILSPPTTIFSTTNMHTLVHFLVLILVFLSYDQLPKPLSVEARKLTSNGLSFAVNLIHRDSPMTPYNSHKRAILGSISSNHHFHLSSTYYDTKDTTIGTAITPNGGDYLMNIAIGTPPVTLTGVADSGSNLMWVQCAPCQHCIPQESPFFDPTKSSTYQTVPCESESCKSPDLESACIPLVGSNGSSCVYTAEYGDGTRSTGILTSDTITFTSTAFPNTTLGCGYDQIGHLGLHGDGIIGLGSGPLSLVSQLGPSINHKFSYCLTPLSSGLNSKLKFGLDVMGPGVVSTPFKTQDPPAFYYLTLNEVSIGNSSVTAGQDVIIDSGTTLTFLETSVYDGIRTAVKGAIGLSPVPDPNKLFDPCYDVGQVSDGGFNPPDVTFHFKGADVVLKAVNTFRSMGNVTCLAMVPTDDTFIFGNIAQVNFEVGYDLQSKLVSFAPADCTKY